MAARIVAHMKSLICDLVRPVGITITINITIITITIIISIIITIIIIIIIIIIITIIIIIIIIMIVIIIIIMIIIIIIIIIATMLALLLLLLRKLLPATLSDRLAECCWNSKRRRSRARGNGAPPRVFPAHTDKFEARWTCFTVPQKGYAKRGSNRQITRKSL